MRRSQLQKVLISTSPIYERTRAAVLLAVGGGIAAYKSAFLCSRLVQCGYDVRVAMTHSATEFVGACGPCGAFGKTGRTEGL